MIKKEIVREADKIVREAEKRAKEYVRDWPRNKLPANQVAFKNGYIASSTQSQVEITQLRKLINMIRHILQQFVSYHTDDNFRKEKEAKFATASGETITYIEMLVNQAAAAMENATNANSIRWRPGSARLTFGEVGQHSLFYIHDRDYNGGLLRYELEVKYLDRRWTSDSIDELKIVALDQLNNLIKDIVK